MATKVTITPALCRQLLDYDPVSGLLTWRRRPVSVFAGGKKRSSASEADWWNRRYAGTPAFTARHSNGYRKGDIFKTRLYAHRVIWAIMTGAWPSGEIDHLNGLPDDNRWDNLRDVSHAINGRNLKRPVTNKSGVVGVSWNTERSKWFAQITVDGVHKSLGLFSSKEDAADARSRAEYGKGFSPRHGRPGKFVLCE